MTDTERLDWLFSELRADAIAKKVEKVRRCYNAEENTPSLAADLRRAFDEAMFVPLHTKECYAFIAATHGRPGYCDCKGDG